MSDHASSSEEETEKFKEAIDTTFLTESLFNKCGKEKTKSENHNAVLPSLRNNFRPEVVINNPLTIKVTPTYQLHVSKHLTKILEKTIENVEVKSSKKKKRKKPIAGIKLLSTSKNYVAVQTNYKNYEKKSWPSINEDSEDSDIEKKAKEVAVSPEWVLSKKELEHWAPNTKGELEIIKCCQNKKFDIKKIKN